MSYFQLQKYLNYLMKLELIDKVMVGNPSITYRVTEKGLDLLKSIEGVLEVLQFKKRITFCAVVDTEQRIV